MTIWEKHARRIRREAQLERIDRWLLEHPWQSRLISLGVAVLVLELAFLFGFAFLWVRK